MARKLIPSSLLSIALLTLSFGFHAPVAHAQGAAKPAAAQTATPAQAGTPAQEVAEDDEYRHSPMVTKLGSFLGMKSDRAATTFTLSNLFILLAGVLFMLYKNLPKTFRSRSEGIQKQIVDARAATQEAKTRLSSSRWKSP